jgi:hypothetical protein
MSLMNGVISFVTTPSKCDLNSDPHFSASSTAVADVSHLLVTFILLLLLLLLWLYSPLLGLDRFFSFLVLYTVDRTPWTGDQPVARPLPTHRKT